MGAPKWPPSPPGGSARPGKAVARLDHARVNIWGPEMAPKPEPHAHQEKETDMDLDKHVAIVTGGGRGIGRATALELARMGATIVVAEFDAANGQRTADEVAKLGRPSSA